jgi:hypothetical protein
MVSQNASLIPGGRVLIKDLKKKHKPKKEKNIKGKAI